MRLEVASSAVQNIDITNHDGFDKGVLHVDKAKLRRLLMEDSDFDDVDFEVAIPGDRTRIIHAIDVVEPRCKTDGESAFPGLIGPVKIAGDGRTYRLAGMGVVSVSEPVAGEPTYWSEGIIDMAGPGAELNPLGSGLAFILKLTPHSDYMRSDASEAQVTDVTSGSVLSQRYNRKVRIAQLRTADYLAKAVVATEPEDIKSYELTPTDPGLPRVAYLFQVRASIYGEVFANFLPTLFHPNEVMDGAFTSQRKAEGSTRDLTYYYQNPSVIESLYHRHGKDIDFVGVVLLPMVTSDMDAKDRAAEHAAKIMRMLGVNGVCATSGSGGNPMVEFMLSCQKLERSGIKTVLAMPESIGGPTDPGFVHFVPEAKAITSAGRTTQSIALPAMDRVIGGTKLFDLDDDPAEELNIPFRYLLGCTTNLGYGRLAGKDY
ncbi:glycine/sarcosine/betaine reductase component B subunit [Dehalococcoidia bacterium]|nr:glycine/sarcosine/betaine reductase component B subunit [Dehalococcoidia bacterium]